MLSVLLDVWKLYTLVIIAHFPTFGMPPSLPMGEEVNDIGEKTVVQVLDTMNTIHFISCRYNQTRSAVQ